MLCWVWGWLKCWGYNCESKYSMQKIFISSQVSQYPSFASAGGFRNVIYSDKVEKIAQLQAKLRLAVLDSQTLRGRNMKLKERLCNINEKLQGQEKNKNIEKNPKRTLKHQRNLSQPNMEIEKQLSNPILKCPQTVKRDVYDLVKMERQYLSFCEEKSTRKVISSKNSAFQGNIINIISTKKDISTTFKHQTKPIKRQKNDSTLAQLAFETVQQIWTSSKTCKLHAHKKHSYLKQ